MDKIDVDKDGYVTEKELEDWVRHVANRWVYSSQRIRLRLSSLKVHNG